MYSLVITIHAIVCILLVGIVLIQSGRGGGLTESFSSAESIFGTKTNVFLVRATTVLASLFVVTCLSLAFISAKSSKSLIGETSSVMDKKETLPRRSEQKEGLTEDIVSESVAGNTSPLPQASPDINATSLFGDKE